MASNALDVIPIAIYSIQSMVHFDISNNRLEALTIPAAAQDGLPLPWAVNLKELLLHGNDLQEIPAELSKFDQLELLDISRVR